MIIANMFVKFDIVKIFRKITFTNKYFCFDFCYANFFDFLTFFFLTNFFDLFCYTNLFDFLFFFKQTNLFDFLLFFFTRICSIFCFVNRFCSFRFHCFCAIFRTFISKTSLIRLTKKFKNLLKLLNLKKLRTITNAILMNFVKLLKKKKNDLIKNVIKTTT